MMLMADADFDPSAAVTFFKKVKIMEDGLHNAAPELQQNPERLSAHPHVSWHFFIKLQRCGWLTGLPFRQQVGFARLSVGYQGS